MFNIETQIEQLKDLHGAKILAHYYEDGDVQEVADYVGDSLYLAQKGEEIDDPVILMAGVIFMGESVKILSPEKLVLVPDMNAGCSLVSGCHSEDYLKWRQKYPDHIAVTYVNSSAEVKALSDVTCTSSNAVKIIESIPHDRKILFGPDQNLGRFLMKKIDRKMRLWPGACEVHIIFSARKLFELKMQHPDALVIAHPECADEVLNYADVVGSTSTLLNEVKSNFKYNKFIVATEAGIFHQMQKLRPKVELIQAPVNGTCACNECPYMKLNTLEKIRDALKALSPQINLNKKLISQARIPLIRMMEITKGNSVLWPDTFDTPDIHLPPRPNKTLPTSIYEPSPN